MQKVFSASFFFYILDFATILFRDAAGDAAAFHADTDADADDTDADGAAAPAAATAVLTHQKTSSSSRLPA